MTRPNESSPSQRDSANPSLSPNRSHDDIAVVGLGCLFPGSQDRHGYWAGLRSGRDHIEQVPEGYWTEGDYHDPDKNSPDRTYGNRGAFLSPIPFHPLDYGITPRDLEATDTSQLLGLVAARQALTDAGYDANKTFDRRKASVILGVTGALELVIPLGARLGHPLWWKALRESGVDDKIAEDVVRKISEGYVDWQENSFPGLLGNVVAGRIANRLDLHGTNCVTDAACASSLAAVHLAALELRSGKSDLVVTGGVDTFNDIFMYMCFSKTPALSPTGDARPFDANGDGTVLGEGLGVVVLKRSEDAIRDGDKIYAHLLSVGTSSDGKGAAIYAPTAPGQQRALNDAYQLANVSPSTIGMVEAHGTGTSVGDATELKALDEVYRQAGTTPGSVALGSVKSQIGHTKAAAGAAGLIKAVLALHHKVQPPSLKIRKPLEALSDPSSPFHVEEVARPWVRPSEYPRRAAVSSFGFGGSNFHAVLEEANTRRSETDWQGITEILAFSADEKEALSATIRDFRSRLLDDHSTSSISTMARETRQSFRHTAEHRLLITYSGAGSLADLLDQALQKLSQEETARWQLPAGIDRDHGPVQGSLAMVFPGQGSQKINMGRNLACRFPAMMETLDAAESSYWNPENETGLAAKIWPVHSWNSDENSLDEQLRRTEVAQPAIGAVSLGCFRILTGLGVQADLFAGHSYGELTALAASGSISESDFHQLSNFRGRLMAEAGGMDAGTMLAVQLPLNELEKLVQENWPDLVVANRNAPEQAVLSGGFDAIEAAKSLLESRGIRCIPLPVSAAFHSSKVASAAQPFEEVLQKVGFGQPSGKVFANSTGQPYPFDETTCRSLLAHQIAKPVLFKEMIESMVNQGATTFIEVGPGKVLGGLIRSITASHPGNITVQSIDGSEEDSRALARTVAVIASRGYPIQLSTWKPRTQAPEVTGKGPAVSLRGANLRPGEGLPSREARPVPGPPAHLPASSSARVNLPPELPLTASKEVGVTVQSSSNLLDQQEALMDLLEQAQEIRELLDRSQRNAEEALSLSLNSETVNSGSVNPGSPPTSHSSHYSEIEEAPTKLNESESMVASESIEKSSTPETAPERMPLLKFMTEVVAEKTGYPLEAIDPSMDLEADLGIDSIKRVEILSAVRQQQPDLPTLSPEILGSLRTLNAMVDHYLPAGNTAAAISMTDAASGEPEPSSFEVRTETVSASLQNPLKDLLIEVVAEKTGYPESAIDIHLDLEGDLGIDSIKRVEILSALRQHRPDLEALPAEKLGSLRTISAIIDHYSETPSLSELSNNGPNQPTPTIDPGSTDSPINTLTVAETQPTSRLADLLREIISEKTGYPTDAIGTDLDLEGDLGIDSIKRVEILSALKQKRSDLPTIPPEQLGSLRTILQLVEALSPETNTSGVTFEAAVETAPNIEPTPLPSESSEPSESAILIPLLLSVIAEKTGYPEDAIGVELDLESDLGIDSIKRVEILSALRQHRPDLPAIPADQLATLRTIQQISSWYDQTDGISTTSEVPEPSIPSATNSNPLILAKPAVRTLPQRETTTELELDKEAQWWVIGSDPLLREEIVKELSQRNVDARHWSMNDNTPIQSPHCELGGMILIGSLEPGSNEPLEAFRWIREAGKRLRQHPKGQSSLHVITRLGGHFGISSDQSSGADLSESSLGGALLGMTRCAAREWADFVVRGIDLESVEVPPAKIAREVTEEIFHGEERWVGLQQGGRQELYLEAIQPEHSGRSPINSGDLLIVTGGARGVTAECLEALTRDSSPALYLLGRTPEPGHEPNWAHGVPDESLEAKLFELAAREKSPAVIRGEANLIRQSREILHRIEQLRSRGCEVTYRSVDVRQRDSLEAVLNEARQRHGSVKGIIHGAGVLADSWIVDKSDEDFVKVWQTKVDPALHLLDLCSTDDLHLVQFFSSTTATLGRKGQSDYAAANETLNQLAIRESQQRPSCHVNSIGWGPWDGGMVDSGLRDLFHSEGVGLIDLAQGADHFVSQVRSQAHCHHIALKSFGTHHDFLHEIGEFPGPKVTRKEISKPAVVPSQQPAISSEIPWEEQLALDISCESDPTLRDHVLQGRAVIPAALLVEWCAQVAAHRNPGLDFIGISNFRVLKGIVIGGREIAQLAFFSGPPTYNGDQLSVPVEIRSRDHEARLHAKAEVLLGQQKQVSSKISARTTAPAADHGDLLFHGDSFRCLNKILGMNDEGITFTAIGTPSPGKGFRSPLLPFWLLDPLRLDAIFQALIIWSNDTVGAPCLPCSISELRVHGHARMGELETRVELEQFSTSLASAKAEVLNENGEPLMTLSGAEVVIDAALVEAFQQQELSEETQH